MKKRIGTGITLLVALIFVLINLPASPAWAEAGDVAINEANFPDKNFRTFVSEKFDKNHDGILSRGELSRVGGSMSPGKRLPRFKGLSILRGCKHLIVEKTKSPTWM